MGSSRHLRYLAGHGESHPACSPARPRTLRTTPTGRSRGSGTTPRQRPSSGPRCSGCRLKPRSAALLTIAAGEARRHVRCPGTRFVGDGYAVPERHAVLGTSGEARRQVRCPGTRFVGDRYAVPGTPRSCRGRGRRISGCVDHAILADRVTSTQRRRRAAARSKGALGDLHEGLCFSGAGIEYVAVVDFESRVGDQRSPQVLEDCRGRDGRSGVKALLSWRSSACVFLSVGGVECGNEESLGISHQNSAVGAEVDRSVRESDGRYDLDSSRSTVGGCRSAQPRHGRENIGRCRQDRLRLEERIPTNELTGAMPHSTIEFQIAC